MSQPEQFLTEDFLRYAAECRRMAHLARVPEKNAPRMVGTLPRWADWAERLRSLYPQPQEAYTENVAASAATGGPSMPSRELAFA
jgi:hypothetical protein